jgi:DNA repair exonuclease SbcCD ATPase subunit
VGLFDQKSENPSNHEPLWMAKSKDTLFDWLVRKAEADLGVAQALASDENQRLNQIKQLETTLVGEISKLQHQIIENREAELNALKSEIVACADRIARFESTQGTVDIAKQVAQELDDLRAQLFGRQSELEDRYSGLERLGESLGAHIRAFEKDVRDKLDGINTVQAETRHFHSETQSLGERISHVESATWQARTLALRNAQQLEDTGENLRAEVLALKASFADSDDKQRSLLLPETLLQELAAKVEEFQNQVAQTHNRQLDGDHQLSRLASGVSILAERMTRVEELSRRTNALAEAEVTSATDFRNKTTDDMATLHAKLHDPAVHQTIQELEVALRSKIQEWEHQAAQQFILLEARDAERENNARELVATLGAKLAEQEARTHKELRALASDQEGLSRIRPEVQALAQRMADTESAAHRAQVHADANAKEAGEFENRLSNVFADLKAEVSKLADERRAFYQSQDELREIERKLDVKVNEIQRQLAIEREGFDHWGKGLRESFGGELSAIRVRLSERQAQIEHRYAALECWQETMNASLEDVCHRVQESSQSQTRDDQAWRTVKSDLSALAERVGELETRACEAEDRAAALSHDSEQRIANLKLEIGTLEEFLDQRKFSSSDMIVANLEEKLSARISDFEERFASQLSQYDTAVNEWAEQSEQIVSRVQNELTLLKADLDQRQNLTSYGLQLPPAVEEALSSKLRGLEQQLETRFSRIENHETEHAQAANKMFETLQSELAAIKAGLNQGIEIPNESSMGAFRESIGVQLHELQQHLAETLSLLESRDVERNQRAEQAITGLKLEMTALSAEITQPRPISAADPVFRGLEEKLSANIEALRQHTDERFSTFDRREAELKELKERSQSLMQRVTQLSGAIQASQKMVVPAPQPMTWSIAGNAVPAPAANPNREETLPEMQARSEKEQLIKLQERMSSEIERVRAELKERSGRWKVRKSAS